MNRAIARYVDGLPKRAARKARTPIPYAPEGPWTFIPPEHSCDFRARAERSIAPTEVPVHVLLAHLIDARFRHRLVDLMITYQPLEQNR